LCSARERSGAKHLARRSLQVCRRGRREPYGVARGLHATAAGRAELVVAEGGVKGLDQAMQHPRLADFLNALVGSNGRMLVSATPSGGRTAIEVRPATEVAGSGERPAGSLFSGIVSDVTGRVIAVGLEGNVSSAERQRELDQRLIPGIPSDLQTGYLL